MEAEPKGLMLAALYLAGKVEEEAIDANAAELPVVQALGQLEAHSSRRPRRAELAGRAAHRAYLLEALTSGA